MKNILIHLIKYSDCKHCLKPLYKYESNRYNSSLSLYIGINVSLYIFSFIYIYLDIYISHYTYQQKRKRIAEETILENIPHLRKGESTNLRSSLNFNRDKSVEIHIEAYTNQTLNVQSQR